MLHARDRWPVCRFVATLALTLVLPLLVAAPAAGQEAQPTEGGAQAAAPDPQAAPWWTRVRFSGDFRTRFEAFRQQGLEDRNRGRIRLRFNFEIDVNDEVTVGMRLATGNPLDPTTANQSFKDFLTRKPLTLHRAYMTYAPKAARGLKLGAGVFEPPVTMTNQIWDDNISWEGAWQQFGRSTKSGFSARAVAAQVVLSELEAGSDALMFAESGEIGFEAGTRALSVTVTDFQYRNVDQVAVAVYSGALDTRNSNLPRVDAAGHGTRLRLRVPSCRHHRQGDPGHVACRVPARHHRRLGQEPRRGGRSEHRDLAGDHGGARRTSRHRRVELRLRASGAGRGAVTLRVRRSRTCEQPDDALRQDRVCRGASHECRVRGDLRQADTR